MALVGARALLPPLSEGFTMMTAHSKILGRRRRDPIPEPKNPATGYRNEADTEREEYWLRISRAGYISYHRARGERPFGQKKPLIEIINGQHYFNVIAHYARRILELLQDLQYLLVG